MQNSVLFLGCPPVVAPHIFIPLLKILKKKFAERAFKIYGECPSYFIYCEWTKHFYHNMNELCLTDSFGFNLISFFLYVRQQ